jgi:hypothetical protein
LTSRLRRATILVRWTQKFFNPLGALHG